MSIYKLDPNLTPDDYREKAKNCYKAEQESFDRCDTDGFLSQWADRCTAKVYNALAVLAENNGKAFFTKLADLETGEEINAKVINSRYGACWMILDSEGNATGEFAPYKPARESTLAKRGYKEIEVERYAVVAERCSEGGAFWTVYLETNDQHENEDGVTV